MNLHRIASLEANGLNATQIASIVNLSPGRISQVQSLDEYKELLLGAKAETEKPDAEDKAIDAKYISAEHSLVDKMISLLPSADMRETILALKTVCDRKAHTIKSNINHNGLLNKDGIYLNQTITINLPKHIVEQHKPIMDVTPSREIVAVDGKTLSPLQSGEVTKLFQSIKGIQTNQLMEPNNNDSIRKGDNNEYQRNTIKEDRGSKKDVSSSSSK